MDLEQPFPPLSYSERGLKVQILRSGGGWGATGKWRAAEAAPTRLSPPPRSPPPPLPRVRRLRQAAVMTSPISNMSAAAAAATVATSPSSSSISSNPRKFSEKIALHKQKEAEEKAEFEKMMKELTGMKQKQQGNRVSE